MACTHLATCVYSGFMLAFLWLCYFPIGIYSIYRFYQYQHHPGLATRYPTVVIAAASICLLHAFFVEQLYYLEADFLTDEIDSNAIVRGFIDIVFPPIFLSVCVAVAFRYWLIHYNISYAVAQSRSEWQSLLTNDTAALRENWYIRHKHDFGNWRYVRWWFIVYFIVGSIVEVAATIFLSSAISSLVYIACLFPLIVLIIVLSCKTPKFEDLFFLRRELFVLNITNAVAMLVYIVFGFAVPSTAFFTALKDTGLTVASFGNVLISTYWIYASVSKVDPNFRRYKQKTYARGFGAMFTRTASNSRAGSSRAVAETEEAPQLVLDMMRKMESIDDRSSRRNVAGGGSTTMHNTASAPDRHLFNVCVSNDACIQLYMNHLRTEFCIENALVFIELVQFLYSVTQRQFAHYQKAIAPFKDIQFEFSALIPTSTANQLYVQERDNWFEVLSAIYDKFIDERSEYQVNVSWSLRSQFKHMLRLYRIKLQVEADAYVFQNRKFADTAEKRSYNFFGFGKSKQASAQPTIAEGKESDDDGDCDDGNACDRVNDGDGDGDGDIQSDDDFDDGHGEEEKKEEKVEQRAPERKRTKSQSTSKILNSMRNLFRGSSQNVLANAAYLEEVKEIEEAKQIEKHDFIALVSCTLSCILQLNYQSISRLKRSKHFHRLTDSVNLDSLLQLHANKGVVYKLK